MFRNKFFVFLDLYLLAVLDLSQVSISKSLYVPR